MSGYIRFYLYKMFALHNSLDRKVTSCLNLPFKKVIFKLDDNQNVHSNICFCCFLSVSQTWKKNLNLTLTEDKKRKENHS